ncbi:MAG: glycosyltransferase family 4 protein [Hyphomicrobiaceae bacterium]
MYSITHLIDDAAVGGVNRMLADQTRALSKSFSIDQKLVNPRHPLPPQVDADIAIVHFTPSWSKLPFLTLLRAQRGDKPIVLVEHTFTRNFEERCVPSRKRFRLMLRLTYQLADVVVAVSRGQARWMQEASLIPAERLVVIQPSVDIAHLLDLAQAPLRPDRPLRLAAYGRYCRQKGFDVLIEAMRLLPSKTATLDIAGYGPDEVALRRAATDSSDVRIEPAVEHLGDFLAAHDAIIIPSRWEAFGLVALEARAAGRPIIVANVDGLVEQAAPSHGVIAAVEEPAALAKAILALSEAELPEMGAAARRSVVNHFNSHLVQWTELLGRLTGRVVKSEAA